MYAQTLLDAAGEIVMNRDAGVIIQIQHAKLQKILGAEKTAAGKIAIAL
jgi:hypothetical protein